MQHFLPMLVALIFLIPTLQGCSGSARPQSYVSSAEHVSRPPIRLNVPLVRQQSDNWCWLAVAQMVIAFKNWGNSPGQCQILEIGYGYEPGYCCSWPQRCDRGGTLDEIRRIVEYYSGREVYMGPAVSADELYAALANQDLVIARVLVPADQGGPTSGPAGHTVVVRGMRYAEGVMQANGASWNTVMPMVLVNDPAQGTVVEATYDELARYWDQSLIIH